MEVDPANPESASAGAKAPVMGRYVEPRALIPGNQVGFLRDGAQAYPAMLAAIDGAKRSVHLESFIFADDATGHRFARALAHAADRGVEVTVLYDAVGSWNTHAGFFRAMRRRGIRARPFNPVWPWPGLVRLFRRDHRKLLVADGEIAFLGGINISDEWAPKDQGGGHWRDDVMRIEGPSVAQLDGVFRATWRAVVQGFAARLQLREHVGPKLPAGQRGPHSVAIFASRRGIHRSYLQAINAAERSVCIASSYFVPDRAILGALRRARRRGVTVQLLLPGRTDHYSVMMAGRALYGRLLRWGVRIHEWQDRVFHSKTAVVDAAWGTMGSFNLDRWSLHFSHELNAVFSDPELGQALHSAFQSDVDRSIEVTLELWKARPRWRRFMEWFFGRFDRWM